MFGSSKVELTSGADVECRYVVAKKSTWRGSYTRLLTMNKTALMSIDPDNWSITNTYPYSTHIVDFSPSTAAPDEFTVTVKDGKKNDVLKFTCDYRSDFLCDLQRLSSAGAGGRRFVGFKITRATTRVECMLEVQRAGLLHIDPDGSVRSSYWYKDLAFIKPIADDASAFTLSLHGRTRTFACPDRDGLLRAVVEASTKLGLSGLVSDDRISSMDVRTARMAHGNDPAPKLNEFDVLKVTSKYSTPRPRRLVLTETHVTEREAGTYSVVSCRPLATLFAIVRHWDEPQKLSLEYTDASSRTYICSYRDELVASVLDAAANAGNWVVEVVPAPVKIGYRVIPRTVPFDANVEAMYLKRLLAVVKSMPVSAGGTSSSAVGDSVATTAAASVITGSSGGPYSADLFMACAEFNANVSGKGVSWGTKKSIVIPIAQAVLTQLKVVLAHENVPTVVTITFLQTISRIVASKESYRAFVTVPDAVRVIQQAMDCEDDGVCYWGVTLLYRLFRNPQRPLGERDAEDAESQVKRVVLSDPQVRLQLVELLDTHAAANRTGGAGALVTLAVVNALDSVLIRNIDTTMQEHSDHTKQLVASRYLALLSLFRSKCSALTEGAALLMRLIVLEADVGTARAMQEAALSEGIILRQFYSALFAPSPDQRYVSRYLVELWCTGNRTARDLFRHMLPPGLLVYLDVPPLSDMEKRGIEEADSGRVSEDEAALGSSVKGLASRLRKRLEDQEAAEKNKVKRRLAALHTEEQLRAGVKKPVGIDEAAVSAAAAASVAAAELVRAEKLKEEGKHENYTIFFHMLMQDHALPDLIWSQQTRGELRASLDAELREIEREIEQGGAVTQSAAGGIFNRVATDAPQPVGGAGEETPAEVPEIDTVTGLRKRKGRALLHSVAWNHSEFEVEYPSLAQELRVADQYLRIFLDSGEALVTSLREPARFFDSLYRRVLRETAPNLKALCIRGMTRVYRKHHGIIREFEDTDFIIWQLGQATSNEVRDRLLELLEALAIEDINAEKMINEECLQLLVDLMITAHTMDYDRRGAGVALKATAGTLMLQDSNIAPQPSHVPGPYGPQGSATDEDADAKAKGETSGGITNPKESKKIWHYRAHPRELREGERPEKGPYSLQDLRAIGQMQKLQRSTLVWAMGMREWVRLDSLRPVLWYVLGEGTGILSASKRGEVASALLLRLVKLRPSVDIHGAPVRPVPRVKRVLSAARCLPHIAQAMLAGSPELVDNVAAIIVELVHYNPAAMVKLYLTGVFFFALAYTGSNWDALSELLYGAHLEQSFHSDAANLTSESSLGRRSILGSMLPESMVCVLANRGPKIFRETLLANVDNPEVIWKYSMRERLIELITQHLGDLGARLAANPCTLYDYCPVPRIIYTELENELWCHNYYLANLTDTARFPDWPITDPVGLLRSVMDAWRLEMDKTEVVALNTDEAYSILGIPVNSDAAEIRKAYRKLAMKYHPDKNPQGRDMFEKIQKAYELLNAARPETAAGPDPLNVILMVKCQCILFRGHKTVLAQYKYAGYPLVLDSLRVPPDGSITGDRANLIEASTELVHLTCLASPRNAFELVNEGGVEVLLNVLSLLVGTSGPSGVNSKSDPKAVQVSILGHVMHTLSGLATLPEARTRYLAVPRFAEFLCLALSVTQAPKVMQHSLQCVARLAVDTVLQDALFDAGVLWRLIPLLFRYDATLEASGADAKMESNEQKAANVQAKLSAAALGRLGGYFYEENRTPVNTRVQAACSSILTPPLAKRLGRSVPDELLEILNSHAETPMVFWTNGMRMEVMSFISNKLEASHLTGVMEADAACTFHFASLADELVLGGVYIKHFLADPAMALDDPYQLCHDLLRHVATSPANPRALPPAEGDIDPSTIPLARAIKHLSQALRSLHMLINNNPGVEDEMIGNARPYLPSLIYLVEASEIAGHMEDRGLGVGAGAGGARSTVGGADASVLELALGVVAAVAPHAGAAGAIADLFLLPPLIRVLPRDPGAIGPILRTLFVHAKVVEQIFRTGSFVDLMLLLAGGPATGPGPGEAGGPSIHSAPVLVVSKPARQEAGALLSMMATDSKTGPPAVMALSQLLPEALAISIKDSVSAATNAGAGGVKVGTAGLGVGAAGASSGGSGGEAVLVFDGDHESPELIWDATCRHELRVALGQMMNGLNGLRQRAAKAGQPGGADGAVWTMPATFRIRYKALEGELKVAGVYVRLFLKEPTYPLRNPQLFLEGLLRRFLQEADHLLGMTSDDADRVREAEAAALREAKEEAASGGVAAGGELMVRGVDVMTQVTHGLVCLLRVRPPLLDTVSSLGFVTKIVTMLSQGAEKMSRYNLATCAIRIVQVLASNQTCVLGMAKAGVVAVIVKSLKPLQRDAAFTLEALKIMLQTDTSHLLVEAALKTDLVDVLIGVLEKDKLDHLVDPSAAKVHAVDIIKLLEADTLYGATATGMLHRHSSSWDKYRHQKHDLFLSRNDTRDYFLTDVSNQPSRLLKNTAAASESAPPPSHPGAVPAPPRGGAGTALVAFGSATTFHEDITAPPPAPDFIPESASSRIGGFQPPAPAPASFGGFQAPAPAPVAYAGDFAAMPAQPAPRPAAVYAPAPVPVYAPAPVPVFAPAPAPVFARPAMATPAPVFAPPPVAPVRGFAAPAPAPPSGGYDPFGGLAFPAPAAVMPARPPPPPAVTGRPAAPAQPAKDPFAGLLDPDLL